MTSVIDVWRAIDPEARLVSGSAGALDQPVRGVTRTRAAPPHLPLGLDGQLLVADAHLVAGQRLDLLLAALHEAELQPVAVVLGGVGGAPLDRADDALPIIGSSLSPASLAEGATTYLRDEPAALERFSVELRLACAEAALAEPEIGAPAGLVAARIRRGVAVSAEGQLQALHARPAGRTLAASFAAMHARLLASATGPAAGALTGPAAARRTRGELWLVERRIRPGASVWIFDDLPLAALDEVAADALTVTLRALLRRPPEPKPPRPTVSRERPSGLPEGDRVDATLLAVARANGRIAPAARALGVHRNTVLYRLRRARAEGRPDPRLPEDALKILADAQRRG